MNPKILDWTPEDRQLLRSARRALRAGLTISLTSVDLLRRYWRELKRRKKEMAPDARLNTAYRQWCEYEGVDPRSSRSWRAFLREDRD